jgi:hypothetical protein
MLRSLTLTAFPFLLLGVQIHPVPAEELLFNGMPYDVRSGDVLLVPGGLNYAETVVPPGTGRLKVLWELRTAEGETRLGEGFVDSDSPKSRFDLGPLAGPLLYDFEAGEVFQKGYRLSLRLLDPVGRPVRSWVFHQEHGNEPSEVQQGMGEVDPLSQRIRLVAGDKERVVFNPRFGALGPLSLRLGESVLIDQDNVEILARLNAGEVPERMACVLRVSAADGEVLWSREIELRRGAGWESYRVDAASWPAGEYRVALMPQVGGVLWTDAPRLRYHRRPPDTRSLVVSPVAPWALERDGDRPEVRIIDFRAEHRKTGGGEAKHWRWIEGTGGAVALAGDGDFEAPPLVIRPPVSGFHAVFVTFEDEGGLIQVGREGLIRGVGLSNIAKEVLVEAADLTDDEIRVFPSRDPRSKLVEIRLVPVTEASARGLAEKLANPVVPLTSVNDWAEYFGQSWARLLPDQFTSVVCVQAEFGFRSVGWSVGRSWVEYPSELSHAQVFPCVPYETAKQSPTYPDITYDYGPRIVMMNEFDPLEGAYRAGEGCATQVWPWLGMHRHYGETFYGGMFSCPFYRAHPEWRQVSKDGRPSGMSFYYPGVRSERVDILVEVAERGADGVLVGCDRQVPMLRYEPPMVEEFRELTGIDPLKIDVTDGPPYEKWIRFRAEFFTETLRELRRRLDELGARQERRIPVGVRIPSVGLFLNLAQGLDVETWCREGLIDLIDLDPLEEAPGEGSQDVRPYLALGRQYGVPVLGGIGSSAFRDLRVFGLETWSYSVITAGLKRARGLHRAGVDGISTWEVEILAWTDPARFAVALYGHPEELDAFLEESNIEAVYPVDAGNAAAGHDNHSVWRPGWIWSMKGFERRSL